MALVAQRGNRRHIQQPRILRAVRRMASGATLSPDRSVLEREWPTHINVALGADGVLVGRGSQIDQIERAVRVMAVGALDQAFIHPVVNRQIELRFLVSVAPVAEPRLRSLQEVFLCLAVVYAVAADATHICLSVRRTLEVGMRRPMAAQTRRIHFLVRMLRGVEDLRDIAASVNVRLACPVAVFTGHAIGAVHLGHLGVRVFRKLLADFFVAAGAGIGANKFRAGAGGLSRSRLSTGCWCSQSDGTENRCHQNENQVGPQTRSLPRNHTTRQSSHWLISMHEIYRLA